MERPHIPTSSPRVSFTIVTPSFNQCAFIGRTAQSILTQAGEFDLRWLVIDGGSSDGTIDLLRSIGDPRLTWISEQDRGQSHALNKGLVKAEETIIGWLNSDDLYAPGALAAVAEAFRSSPQAQWLIGRCEIIDCDDRVMRSAVTRYKDRALGRYRYRKLLRENFVSQPAVFWRRHFGRSVGPVDETLHHAMDYDLWLRMGRACDPLVLDRVLARFRLHPSSKSGRLDRERFAEQYAVANRYFAGDTTSRLIHRIHIEKIVWSYRLMRRLGL